MSTAGAELERVDQTTLAPPGSEEAPVQLTFFAGEEGAGAIVAVNGKEVGETDPISFRLSDPNLPIEVWTGIVRQLGRANRWTRWALADAIIFGEKRYGEMYDVAADVSGLTPETVKQLVYIASNVPRSRRRPELGISFHALVAPLSPKEQRAWLDKAVRNQWPRATLAAEIKRSQNAGVEGPMDDKPRPGEMLTKLETLTHAGSLVWKQAQPDGAYFRVPREAMMQLASALGEGE